jgi:CDP-4-dehydro-6-deoxyglucose reductase, E1
MKKMKHAVNKIRIPLIKNAFTENRKTMRALADFVLHSKKLSMGEKCVQFEKSFALMQGRRHAVLFNSGGSSNLALLQALKNLGLIKEKDKIGFSALTWSTNVMPIIQLGLEAVPIDCRTDTLNCMSETAIPELKRHNCKSFFITNALGFAGDLDKIKTECEKENIVLLEDNCESLGTELEQGYTGNFGLASTFSFFIAHHLSTIEGGMVCTDNLELSNMLKIVRANGWDRNLNLQEQKLIRKKHHIRSEFEAKYSFYDLGFNLRPTEITGLLGLTQLKYLKNNMETRKRNFLRIDKIIRQNDDFVPISHSHIKFVSAFAIPFVCKSPKLRLKYVNKFNKAGIEIRPVIAGNMQRQPFYKKYVKNTLVLSGADFLHYSGFYCGNSPDYSEKEIQCIIDCIKI